MKSTQNAVFNLTGRQRILAEHIRMAVDGDCLHIHNIEGDGWAEDTDQDLLELSILHLDIRSLYYQARQSVPMNTGVLEPGWDGIRARLPGGLGDGSYRVKAQVSVVLPANHPDGGRVLARSEEFVVLEGDMGDEPDGGGDGGSLLPTRANRDLDGICRLAIGHRGPVLEVNSNIDGLAWREIAMQPYFKYAVFTPCLEAVLLHIALSDEDTETWSEDWLKLPGVDGLDDLIQREDEIGTAYKKALEWSQACAGKVEMNRGVVELFTKARERVEK